MAKRNVNNIVIHCTATPQNASVQGILNYWKNNLGWKSVGYHRLIEADGTIHKLANFDQVTNGVKDQNSVSIHISYIGGIDNAGRAKDTRTFEQKIAILKCIAEALRYTPNANILGHKDFPNVKKACPSFDAIREYDEI